MIFNTDFEIGLRVCILLSISYPDSLGTEDLAALDLISTYGKDYGASNANLHGDNKQSFNELNTRRAVVRKAIQKCGLDGYIRVDNSSKGFRYVLTEDGRGLVESLDSDYYEQYTQEAKKAFELKNRLPEGTSLMKYVRDAAVPKGGIKQ